MTSPDAPSTTMRPFLKRTPHALHNVLAPVGPFLHNGVFCVRQHAHVTPASGNASFSRSAPGFAESDENVAERRRPASVVSSDSTDDLSRRRAAEAYTPFKNPIGSYEPPFVVNAFDGVIAPGVNIYKCARTTPVSHRRNATKRPAGESAFATPAFDVPERNTRARLPLSRTHTA